MATSSVGRSVNFKDKESPENGREAEFKTDSAMKTI
jgi:hypothetical protein